MDYYILTPISFILRIFEAFSQFSLVLSLLGGKIFTKKHFIGSILFSIIFELGKLICPQYLSGFLAIILGIPFITIYFKEKLWKVGLSYILTGIVVALLDFIVLMGLSLIFHIEKFDDIVDIPLLYDLGCLIISISLLAISQIVTLAKKKCHMTFEILPKSTTSLVNAIVTFLLLVPNLVMLSYYHDDKNIPLVLIIVNILAIIAMFFVSTYNTKKGFELITTEQELVTQRTYNKTLQNLVDGLRTFKHDYNNTLQTMYGYIQLNDIDGLKEFFEQILDESRAITALDKLNPDLFKNPSLFGLITAKYEYARQNNVSINFEMYGKLEEADMQIYDLTRILGIFLDNAIEASVGSKKKKVNFMVIKRKNKIVVEITNTYSELGLRLENINDKGVSSKGENRGLGLYKVKDILRKYPKVEHQTKASNGMFMQRLSINEVKVMSK